ncbi:MAG: archease [Clostridia bacterium]
MSRPYEVLEHTADIGVRARGRTLEETFANMAAGLMSLVAPGPGCIQPKEERRVEARAADLEGLLVAWLAEFVYLIDAERFLVAKIEDIRVTRCEPKSRPGREPARPADRECPPAGDGETGTVRPGKRGARDDGTRGAFEGGAAERAGGPAAWTVTALVRGEGIDLTRHALEMEIKGVSYHMVKVERETGAGTGPAGAGAAGDDTGEAAGGERVCGGGWVAQAIFDI